MANYNPHAPYILGHEWAPIRQNNVIPTLDTEEYGHSFSMLTGEQVTGSAYYVKTVPPHTVDDNVHLISIYEKGTEHLSGPIRSIIFPVKAIEVTGAALVSGNVASVLNPADNDALVTAANAATCIGITFDIDTATASALLSDKRILGMNVLYTTAGTPTNLTRCTIWLGRRKGKPNLPASGIKISQGWEGADTLEGVRNLGTAPIGPVSPFTSTAIGAATSVTQAVAALPWTYAVTDQGLALLGRTPYITDSLQVAFSVDHTVAAKVDAQMRIGYIALEVIFCDEQRLKFGGDRITETNSNPYGTGQRTVHAALVSSSVGPGGWGSMNALVAGDYTVTHALTSCSPGVFNTKGYPELNAIRQLYEVPTVPGVLVRNTGKLGTTFTREATDIMQLVTLHTSTHIVTGVHAYGDQLAAPVFQNALFILPVTQGIYQGNLPTPAVFPQVRFYARRWQNDPSAPMPPLTLTGASPPITGSSVSITAAEFDALPEIIDGWREVNLRFAAPPTFPGGSTIYDWKWTTVFALTQDATRWEVLAANVKSLPNDVAGGQMNTDTATYQPPQASTGGAYLTSYDDVRHAADGTTLDFTADATLIFSQDPPVVTGFGITTGSMAITGIGIECSPDACIPTGIYCNNLAWQAIPTSALPTTGFGAYQIERFDSYDNEWQLIMETGSMAVTGFCDYEARVGVPSLYRIRVTNVLDFAGAWVTGSATIPAPGVIVSGTGNSTLIFTTNVEPTHSLAYTMNWDNRPEEFFDFPESDMVQLQQMYGKNFVTAFRPTERGGERFSRMLLVQDAAIPLPSLGNFRGLRDLAWDQIPYVCVRDELGNRWYATVLVPSGSVTRNRRLYYAQVDIIEVTDTACAVDPAG